MLIHVILTIALLAALLESERRGWKPGVWAFKPATSSVFIAAALVQGAAEHSFGVAMLIALGLSAVGDVLLIPASDRWFRLGLASFLAAHVVYAWAFAWLGVSPALLIAALAVTGAAGLLILRWLAPHVPPKLTLPVSIYVAVISVMVAAAVGAAGGGAPLLLPVAAAVFWVSDLFVARRRFVRPGFLNKLVGLPLYYAAQLMFAWLAGTWRA